MPPKIHPPTQHRHVDPHPETSEESVDEEEEVDLLEVMKEMPLHERRSIYALKGLVEDFKTQRRALMAKLQAAEQRYKEKEAALLERRSQIVSGALAVTPEDAAAARADLQRREAEDKAKKGAAAEEAGAPAAPKKKGVTVLSEEEKAQKKLLEAAAANPAGGIPGFWLQALRHGSATEGVITDRDEKALLHLRDIKVVLLSGNDAEATNIESAVERSSGGFRIEFYFDKNEYFTNPVLTKTYHMVFDENDESEHVAKIEGCSIDWTSSKNNLTVVVKQKKQRNKNTKQIRVIEKEEPTDSFFNFFKAPKLSLGEDDDGEDEEDEEDDEGMREQEFEMDMEIAQHITEDLVPHAAYFYAGKSVDDVALELMKQYGAADEEEEEEEEEEDEDEGAGDSAFSNMVASRGRGGRGGGGAGAAGGRGGNSGARGGRGGAQPQQQECKQQ